MQIRKQIQIDSPPSAVWNIVGTRFNDISELASFVQESHAIPDLPEGSGRVCQTSFGPVKEDITHFDDAQMTLSHTIEGNSTLPFVKDILNTWKIDAGENGGSLVTFEIQARLVTPFKQLLGGRMRRQLGKQAEGYVNELKQFAEQGEPVPA